MNKFLKKTFRYLLSTIVILFTITLLFSAQIKNIFYALEHDKNDKLEVISPIPNSTLRNSQEIKYKIYDNDQSIINSIIEIRDQRCQSKLRTLMNSQLPSKDSYQIKTWDTKSAYIDGSALTDGSYCLMICADFKNKNYSYNACNSRTINIRNYSNQNPIITSSPITKIIQGQNYSYKIQATDLDGDNMSFRVIQKPDFLNFSNQTLSAVNIQTSGTYKIIIEVKDEYNGITRQEYYLNVIKKQDQKKNEEEKEIESKEIIAEFLYPIENSVFSEKENKIEWKLDNKGDKDNVNQLILEYRKKETQEWKALTTIPKSRAIDQKQVNWDVSTIENGEYILKIKVQNKAGKWFETQSSYFQIQNDENNQKISESDINIHDLKPGNGEAIKEKQPEISAKITGKNLEEIKLENIKLFFDEIDISNKCKLNAQNVETNENTETENQKTYILSCQIDKDLENGNYILKLEVNAKDIEKQEEKNVVKTWEFSVIESELTSNQEETIEIFGTEIPRTTFNLIGVLCLLTICLILLPLILFTIWRRRTEAESETFYPQDNTPEITEIIEESDTEDDIFTSNLEKEINQAAQTDFQQVGSSDTTETNQEKNITETKLNKNVEKQEKGLFTKIKEKFQGSQNKNKHKDTEKISDQAKQNQKSQHKEEQIYEEQIDINDTDPSDNPLAPVSEDQKDFTQSSEDYLMPIDSDANNTNDTQTTKPKQTQPITKSQVSQKSFDQEKTSIKAPKEQKQPISNQTQQQQNDDLPDWLKGDIDAESTALDQKGETQVKKNKTKEKEDDSADPYDFGNFSIGQPD